MGRVGVRVACYGANSRAAAGWPRTKPAVHACCKHRTYLPGCIQAAALEEELAEFKAAAEEAEHKLSAVREYATSNVDDLNAANDRLAELEQQLAAAKQAADAAVAEAAAGAAALARVADLEQQLAAKTEGADAAGAADAAALEEERRRSAELQKQLEEVGHWEQRSALQRAVP